MDWECVSCGLGGWFGDPVTLPSAPYSAVQPGGAVQSPLPTPQPAQPVALPGPVQSVAPQQLLAPGPAATTQPVSPQIQPVPVSPGLGVTIGAIWLHRSPTIPPLALQVLLQPHFIKADSLLLTAVKTDAGGAKTSSITSLATSSTAAPLQVPVGDRATLTLVASIQMGFTPRPWVGVGMLGDPFHAASIS